MSSRPRPLFPSLARSPVSAFSPGGAARLIIWPLRRLQQLRALARQRRALARLDERLLDDIGLSEAEARRETGRSFWDAPSHWF